MTRQQVEELTLQHGSRQHAVQQIRAVKRSDQLERIETYVRELRTLIRPQDILTDIVVARFAEHTLPMAVQEAVDVAREILFDGQNTESTTSPELIERLGQEGWLLPPQVELLKYLVNFRNRKIVHPDKRAIPVDDQFRRERIRDMVEGKCAAVEDLLTPGDSVERTCKDDTLDGLLRFCDSIRGRISGSS